jgi:hypothetical protein
LPVSVVHDHFISVHSTIVVPVQLPGQKLSEEVRKVNDYFTLFHDGWLGDSLVDRMGRLLLAKHIEKLSAVDAALEQQREYSRLLLNVHFATSLTSQWRDQREERISHYITSLSRSQYLSSSHTLGECHATTRNSIAVS